MPEATGSLHLLTDLALILCVAALTTVVFQRIRQPVILGYLLAGMIVGPHLPIPLFADEKVAHTLSELGVVLLMFWLGLEFHLRRLLKVAPTAGVAAVIQCSLLLLLGYLTGKMLGWTSLESLFAGAMIVSSSTTIIIKAFGEQKISRDVSELVFGILIFEDLIGILLIAILTAVGSGMSLSAWSVAVTIGKLAGFLVGLLLVGMLVIPRLMRLVVRLGRQETIVVASVGLCFGFALTAREFGYSVVLGAFLGGALVAESGAGEVVTKAISPVVDVFAAVFFVSVGMLIDPALIAQHWMAVAVMTAVVVVGKLFGVILGAFLAGFGVRTSVQAGMSLAQIGEFSFIIAGIGLSLGVTGNFLYPVAISVSAITTLTTPWFIRVSGRLAEEVDRRLPHIIQTYVSLYGSWLHGLRTGTRPKTLWTRFRRPIGWLLLDMLLIGGIAVGASLGGARVIAYAQAEVGLAPSLGRWLVIALTVLLILPFAIGATRTSRRLAAALATEALPAAEAGLDLAAAPRRALLVTLQIAILLLAGGPLVAVIQPFYPSLPGAAVLLGMLALLVYPLWRSAANLHGHARAGAQAILEAVVEQGQAQTGHDHADGEVEQQALALVPGLGSPALVRIEAASPALGRSLKQICLRGRTGATVIAISRCKGEVVYPDAEEVLRQDDVLVLTGTAESVSLAKGMLSPNATDGASSEDAPGSAVGPDGRTP
jgi:CPA2 family monovalent cation:H+ antiporter-2